MSQSQSGTTGPQPTNPPSETLAGLADPYANQTGNTLGLPVNQVTGQTDLGPDTAGMSVSAPAPTTSMPTTPAQLVAAGTPQPVPSVAAPNATQSALGGPAPVTITPQGLAERASQLVKLYPSMKNSPALVSALAGLPIADEDLFGSVGQTLTAAQAQTQAAVLTDMTDATARWKRWQSFSKEAQAAIEQTGMPAPTQPNPSNHRSFWDQLGHDLTSMGPGVGAPLKIAGMAADLGKQAISDVSGAVGRDVAQPLGLGGLYQHVVGPVARTPGDIMNLPSHVYRFLDVGQKGGGISPSAPDLGQAQGTAKLDPAYISRAWEATAQGKPFYRIEDYQKAQQQVSNDPQKLDLAVAISQSGGDITAGVQKLMGPAPVGGPTPQYSQKAGRLFALAQSDPHVLQAAKTLSMAGVSPGRDGARDMGLKEGTTAYSAASGAMDAAFQWYLNPLNAVGRVNSIAKASRALTGDNFATALDDARFGDEENAAMTAGDTRSREYWLKLGAKNLGHIPGKPLVGALAAPGSAVRAVSDTAARQRFNIALADHANQGNAMGWLTARPQDAKGYSAFQEHVNTFLKPMHGPGYQVTPNDVNDWIAQGGGHLSMARGQFSSYLSPNDVELPRLSKTGAAAVWAKTRLTPVSHLAANPHVGLDPADLAPTQGHLAKIGSLLGNAPYNVGELLTSQIHDGKVELAGPNAIPSFARYVRQFLLPSPKRDQLVNAFADVSTTAMRRDLVRQATEAGMRQMHFDTTEAGQQWMDKILSGMRENYDPKGRDILDDGSHKAALAPDLEEASAMEAPTLPQLWEAGREANVLGVLTGGLTNPQFETIMHKVWAPLALLRLGEVPRLVSEEWMTALMRLDPSEIAKGYAGSWLPRIAARMGAYDGIRASNPISRFGGILAARALGMLGDPQLEEAGTLVQAARSLHGERKDAYEKVEKAAREQTVLAKRRGLEHEDTKQAAQVHAEAKAVLQETMDRAARNEIVKQAWGRMFATGGGYLHSVATTGDLEAIDNKFQPVARLKMRGYYRKVDKGGLDDTDPAYLTAAAEYLGKFGRSGMYRAGLDAISGYGGSTRDLSALRGAFNNTLAKGKSDRKMLTDLRTAYQQAHPDVQEGIRYYQRAVASGSIGAQVDAGSKLRDMHTAGIGEYQLGKDEKALVNGVIGPGNYRPAVRKMPDEELGNIKDKVLRDKIARYRKTRSATVKAQLGHEIAGLSPDRVATVPPESGAPLDSQAISAIFSDPHKEIITSPARAATVAADAMERYTRSPAFADYIPNSDHLQYDLAQPLPKGHTRLYYPAAPPDWQPGQLNLDSIDNPVLAGDVARTVLNRRLLSTQVDQATENLTHQAIGLWGTTYAKRAEAVADHLAPGEGMVGYVDVPNAMRDAQRYGQASVEHLKPENPWLPAAKDAKRATEQIEAKYTKLGIPLDGYQISEEQQANGHLLKDGHEVLDDGTWANGRSLAENQRRLAEKNADALVDAFLPNGRFLHGPVHDLLRQDPKRLVFDLRHLKGVPVGDLPETVVAPLEMQVSPTSLLDRALTRGFGVIGAAQDSLVRSEAFTNNLAKALRAAKVVEPHLVDQGLRAYGEGIAARLGVSTSDLRHALDMRAEAKARGGAVDPEVGDFLDSADALDKTGKLDGYGAMETRVDDHLNQIATERAVRDTIPYINNHHAQSNMAFYMRNVSPFLWAQESFLKRWARALRYNPATFERLELGIHGLGSIGIIHKNAYGQNAITVPGSGSLTHLLGSLGMPYQIAASVPFTMEVKSLTPGFARPAIPASGPALTMPLAFLMGSQPEAKALGGDLGIPPTSHSGMAGALEQLVPAGWARNVWSAYMSNPDAQQFASARLEAMQLLAASGHAPSPGADAAALQTWQHQVGSWTRNVMILRGALGFVSPATPTLDPTDVKVLDGSVGGINRDLKADMAMFGATEGITKFMETHPDSGAYTVFATTSAGGETVPATHPAEQMLQDHADFFDAHPYAGAYFLPQAPGPLDHQAYATELADGIRVRKGWDTIATEIINSAASDAYYKMHDYYLQALQGMGTDRAERKAVEQYWGNWSKTFEAANPLFAAQLNSSTGKATRGNVIDDMRNALATGNTPNPEAARQIGGMLQLYDYWEQAHAAVSGQNTAQATDLRKSYDASFQQLAARYVQHNPMAAMFYQRTIVPQIAQADRTLGQALEVSVQ